MIIKAAKRTESVQEYYFSMKLKEIARMNAERLAAGDEPVINLGIGSPDGMPPMEAVDALCESARQSGNHAYQSYVGLPELRKAFADAKNSTDKPSVIIANTIKGKGVSFMEFDILWHYRFPHEGEEYDGALKELHENMPDGVVDPYQEKA